MNSNKRYTATSLRNGAFEDNVQSVKLTKAQEIQHLLADDIVHGRLRPGTGLDETIFASKLGVSRTPIREAIRQLEAIGLVETRPHRGAVVTDISAERIDDMVAVMAELEALCARWAATAMSAEERQMLTKILAESAAYISESGRAKYRELNELFHDAIYEGSHSAFLAEQTRAVRLRLAPFRRLKFEYMPWLTRSHEEHRNVAAAIQAGDGDEAHRLMLLHLATVREALYIVRRAVDPVSPGLDAPAPTSDAAQEP